MRYQRKYKGNDFTVSLPFYGTTGTTAMKLAFYTDPDNGFIERNYPTGITLDFTGHTATAELYKSETDQLEDGLLKYTMQYTADTVSRSIERDTPFYLKTPTDYQPGTGVTSVYQPLLVSGTNIKTINNQSILGSGNLEISGGSASEYSAGTNISIANNVISVTGITVPTRTSQLTNDSGFLTSHQSLEGYATETWVEGKGYLTEHQSLAGKQDLLVSGSNIKTVNNQSLLGSGNIEISGGTGVTYSAGTNISIADNVISVTGISVPTKTSQLTNDSGFLTSHQSLAGYATETWVENKGYKTGITSSDVITALGYTPCQAVALTQAQYDALATKDNNTIYGII